MSRQQKWARCALAKVTKQKGEDEESHYRTLCMKLPALLKQSGTMQAIAFLLSRKEPAAKQFTSDLAAVFGATSAEALRRNALEAPLPQYLVLSRDLIDISVWFRRFAQSELADDDKLPGGADAGPT